jgi:hypothetical protein
MSSLLVGFDERRAALSLQMLKSAGTGFVYYVGAQVPFDNFQT